jgi:hypothetical protein
MSQFDTLRMLAKALDEGRLKHPQVKARGSVLECARPLALSSVPRSAESSTGVDESRALPRNAHIQRYGYG